MATSTRAILPVLSETLILDGLRRARVEGHAAMKRAAKLNPLPISLDSAAPTPLWRQVSIGLRIAIANGRLGPGARLPSTRALARHLEVSRNTVMAAYEDVAARGLLVGHTGAGSFVASTARTIARARIWFQDDSGNLLTLGPLA